MNRPIIDATDGSSRDTGERLCQQLGMTVEELATAVGVARDTVRSWERGAAAPRGKTAERVAELVAAALERPQYPGRGSGCICDAEGCRRRPLQGALLCAVHQRRRIRREPQQNLVLGAGEAMSPSGFGLLGVLDRDYDAVMCHECAGWYKTLGPHLKAVHEMTAAEYRDAHQLPAQIGLTSLAYAQINSENARQRIGTRGWERFVQARDQVLPSAQASGIEANQRTVAGTRAARAADARRRLTPPQRDEQKWQQRLTAYRHFVEARGRAPSRGADDEDERFLAVWLKNQRAEARRGKLPEWRRAALAAEGCDLGGGQPSG